MNFVSPGTWMWFLPAAGAIVLLYIFPEIGMWLPQVLYR